MTTKGYISTKGFAEFLEKIVESGQDVDQAAQDALTAGGEVALNGMQRRVPKDEHNLEKNLSLSEPQQDGNYSFIEVGLLRDVDAETVRYGNAQEYGSSSMAAQPYIRPTMAEDAGKIRKAMKESLIESGTL